MEPTTGGTTGAPSSLSRVIALVTALRADDATADLLTAVLSDPADEPVDDFGFDACWLAAALVRAVDERLDGAGTEWLQGLAALAASE